VLVESDGEVLLVECPDASFEEDGSTVLDLSVFRADLSEKKWMRVDSLGDRVLFLDDGSSLSLLAADVGCMKNCVYSSDFVFDLVGWSIFDLATRRWIDRTLISYKGANYDADLSSGHWFLPTLGYVNPAKAS